MCTHTSYVDALGAAGLEFTYTSEVLSIEGKSWLSEPREVWSSTSSLPVKMLSMGLWQTAPWKLVEMQAY